MLKTCSKCGEAFDLLPDKPGFANVCPSCTQPPEETVRKAAVQDSLRKSLAKASLENQRKRDQSLKEDRKLEALGFERVPGKKFTFQVPKERG
jgi:predicted  nucleic acid-binding Zn-ribbon protein